MTQLTEMWAMTDQEEQQLDALPTRFVHEGKAYYSINKRGRNIATDLAVACYESDDHDRIWLDAKGRAFED